MKIVRVKRNWLGGVVIALCDVQGNYVSGEFFVLPGKKDVVAKQLAAIIGEFRKDPLIVGIMEDLQRFCVQHGVSVDPKWRTYRVPQK